MGASDPSLIRFWALACLLRASQLIREERQQTLSEGGDDDEVPVLVDDGILKAVSLNGCHARRQPCPPVGPRQLGDGPLSTQEAGSAPIHPGDGQTSRDQGIPGGS
jgi:hypothetical protein